MLRSHTHSTKPTSAKSLNPSWKLVDAKGKVLGRIATDVAVLLQGKHKATYVSHLETGDHVVVINAAEVSITGRKSTRKVYSDYSGYPGGLRKEVFEDLFRRNPAEVVRRAVSGMLPKNKLRDRRLARLHIYADAKHPYENQIVS